MKTYLLEQENLTPTGKLSKKQPGIVFRYPAAQTAKKGAERLAGGALEWEKRGKGEWVAETPKVRYRVKAELNA